jgi:hypothetical protein
MQVVLKPAKVLKRDGEQQFELIGAARGKQTTSQCKDREHRGLATRC